METNDISSKNLVERKCPVCGKIFVPAPFHVYKDGVMWFCKWTCLCEYRRNMEAYKEKRQKTLNHRRVYSKDLRAKVIRMVLEDGKTQKEVASELGLKYTTVNSWLESYRRGIVKL